MFVHDRHIVTTFPSYAIPGLGSSSAQSAVKLSLFETGQTVSANDRSSSDGEKNVLEESSDGDSRHALSSHVSWTTEYNALPYSAPQNNNSNYQSRVWEDDLVKEELEKSSSINRNR